MTAAIAPDASLTVDPTLVLDVMEELEKNADTEDLDDMPVQLRAVDLSITLKENIEDVRAALYFLASQERVVTFRRDGLTYWRRSLA